MPALEAAISALKSLTKPDIVEVKAMKNPPKGVKQVRSHPSATEPNLITSTVFHLGWAGVNQIGTLLSAMQKKSERRGGQVMEAVCILLGVRPDRVDAPDGRTKVNDYWKPAQKVLADARFLTSLMEYDKEQLTDEVVGHITPFMTDPSFEPKVFRSPAIPGVDWVQSGDGAREQGCDWAVQMGSGYAYLR